MNARKLIAGITLILTLLFPFRLAFLDQPDHGPKALLNFLLVLAGAAIFAILLSGDTRKESQMTASRHENDDTKKQAA